MSNNRVILKRSSVVGKVPSLSSLEYGELALNYADGKLYYRDTEDTIRNLVAGGVSNQSIYRETYTAFEGDDTFVVQYTPPNVDVYINGIRLKPSEYTATSGTNIVLNEACIEGDVVDIIGYVNVAFTDFGVIGDGISFNETEVKVYLSSSSTNQPDTLVYRDSNGNFAANNVTLNSLSIDNEYNFPTQDGDSGQILVTDGQGNLTFIDPFTTGSTIVAESTNPTLIDTIDMGVDRSAEYFITISTGSGFCAFKVILLHDSVDVFWNVSSVVGEDLGLFSAEVNNSMVDVYFTPVYTPTQIKYVKTSIRNTTIGL